MSDKIIQLNEGCADKKLDYSEKEKEKALGLYDKTKSITEVIRRLGYPSRQAMYTWIANRNKPWRKRKSIRGINTAEHPRHPSAELKLSVMSSIFRKIETDKTEII